MELNEVHLAHVPVGNQWWIGRRAVGEEVLIVELVLPHQFHGQALRARLLHQGQPHVIPKHVELRLQRRPAIGGQTTIIAKYVARKNGEDVPTLLEVVGPAAPGHGGQQKDGDDQGQSAHRAKEDREKRPGAAMASLAG